MKRLILLTLTLFTMTVGMMAQDWTGRVYECTESDNLRMQIVNEMKSDPDFEKMDFEEKRLMSTLVLCMNVKMTLKFKKDQKVQTVASLSLDDAKMEKNGVNWAMREMLSAAVKTLASDMNSTSKYSVKGNTVTIDGDGFTIVKDGQQLILKDDDLVLHFNRKK